MLTLVILDWLYLIALTDIPHICAGQHPMNQDSGECKCATSPVTACNLSPAHASTHSSLYLSLFLSVVNMPCSLRARMFRADRHALAQPAYLVPIGAVLGEARPQVVRNNRHHDLRLCHAGVWRAPRVNLRHTTTGGRAVRGHHHHHLYTSSSVRGGRAVRGAWLQTLQPLQPILSTIVGRWTTPLCARQ